MEGKEISPLAEKILKGLEKSYEKLVAYKKSKDSPLVIMSDGKIAWIKPRLEKEDVSELYRNKQK